MGMWTIMEEGRDGYNRGMGFRSMEEERAFKEGCRYGYEKAMEEMHSGMGMRTGDRPAYRNYGGQQGTVGERRFPGYMPESPYMGMRGDDEIDERRRRRANGEFM